MSQWKAKPIVDRDFGYEVVAGSKFIACVFKLGDFTHATACLIAAAPELLEAVQGLTEDMEDGHWSATKKYLRELIAKATGAQP